MRSSLRVFLSGPPAGWLTDKIVFGDLGLHALVKFSVTDKTTYKGLWHPLLGGRQTRRDCL